MRILLTGAAGFIGRAVCQRLLADPPPALAGAELVLLDRQIGAGGPGVRWVVGELQDDAIRRDALAQAPDLILHLASLPGGAAEADFVGGMHVNLEATLALAQAAAALPRPPRFVFASSIAVFGPGVTHEDDQPAPPISYGAHKLMAEIFLADLARRNMLDAVSVRLPGIVARPRARSGLGSAYLSDMFHALHAGEHFVCPTTDRATSWMMSADRCVDNLLHAASMGQPARRVFTLPALCVRMSALAGAIATFSGRAADVDWAPDAHTEALFGTYQPLAAPSAERAGFADDGTLAALVARVLSRIETELEGAQS